MAADAKWPQRHVVLWVGPPEPKSVFIGSCEQHGLQVRSVAITEVAAAAHDARALLMPVAHADVAFMKRAKDAARYCAQHGMIFGLVLTTDAAPPRPPAEKNIKEYFKAFRMLEEEDGRLRGFGHHWSEAASELAHVPATPGQNITLVISGADVNDEEVAILLRRAFHDWKTLHLEPLASGKSGAHTFRVTDGSAPPAHRPMIAKLSAPDKIDSERSGYLLINERVPSRLYAPIVEERSLLGHGYAIVVYRFLERCDPLAQRLDAGPPFIDQLFDSTLRDLHFPLAKTPVVIHEIFGDSGCKALRWTPDLADAAMEARKRGIAVPSASELRILIEEIPRNEVQIGTIHGDLHLANVFVPRASTEAIIIDYGNVRSGLPIVADPACLEVSLTFTPGFLQSSPRNPVVSAYTELLEAYQFPLSPTSAGKLEQLIGRDSAAMVQRIREVAERLDENTTSYPLAVASYLLRYACYSDNGTLVERSVAYELAAKLLSDSAVEVHQIRARAIGQR